MTSLFAAASAPSILIGRSNQMQEISQAVFAPGDELRVVYIVGEGGLGKSRILAETYAALAAHTIHGAGHSPSLHIPEDASPVRVARVLDLEPVHLSTTIRFINDLVNSLDPNQEDFATFREAHNRHRQALVFQSSYSFIQQALEEALNAFRSTYQQINAAQRVVWLLDTGEKFAIPIPPLFDNAAAKILKDASTRERRRPDTPVYTHDWLRSAIAGDPASFQNTTIIMAGRPEPTWWDIFADVPASQVHPIHLKPLTPNEIAAYFDQLAVDLQDNTRFPASSARQYAVRRLQSFSQPDLAWVLWAYTNGQPVRLAILANLLIDGSEEPEQLSQSRGQVEKHFAWNPDSNTFEAHVERQAALHQLGDLFVKTLFDYSDDLRANILLRLVRARHPLDAETLEYLIYSRPDEHYFEWLDRGGSQAERLAKIDEQLTWLLKLAFFKYRMVSYGDHFAQQLQIYLQDVVYEVIDEYFMKVSTSARDREVSDRQAMYGKLIEVINYRRQRYEDELRKIWYDERSHLETEIRSRSVYAPEGTYALDARFPDPDTLPLSRRPRLSRTQLRDRVEELQLDKLYYKLRISPRSTLNDDYIQLADSAWLEHDEDFMTQVEIQVWRLLKDKSAHKLVPLEADKTEAAQSAAWDRLERVVHQDHALRWLKRLHARARYDEVGAMAEFIRGYAAARTEPWEERHSWNHTLTREEIHVYEGYAMTYTGRPKEAIELLLKARAELRLVLTPGHPERDEEPFETHGRQTHDGADRVRRVIGVANFILGYAYTTYGDFAGSHAAYTEALPYLHGTRFRSLEIYTKFNMARSLAEMGYTRDAVDNCEDALKMLTEDGKGDTLPYAYASNTLALIRNMERNPVAAWLHAAVAHACFERMGEVRGKTLAELQFGEALRRIGDTYGRPQDVSARLAPALLYDRSEAVLRGAYRRLLTHPVLKQETLRHVEGAMELASSLRDQVRILDANNESEREQAKGLLREANLLFKKAAEEAQRIEHRLLLIDALWGMATLDYRARQKGVGSYKTGQPDIIPLPALVTSFRTVDDTAVSLGLLDRQTILSEENPLPGKSYSNDRAVRRVARVYGRLGRIYSEAFVARSDRFRSECGILPYTEISEVARKEIHHTIRSDATADRYLTQMADHYALAYSYALLYNPQAVVVQYLRSDLYSQLKVFNALILHTFAEKLASAEAAYHLNQVSGYGEDPLTQWFARSFGPSDINQPQSATN